MMPITLVGCNFTDLAAASQIPPKLGDLGEMKCYCISLLAIYALRPSDSNCFNCLISFFNSVLAPANWVPLPE